MFHPDFNISKIILQNKIHAIANNFHNKINMLKTEEDMKIFIEKELDVNIKNILNISKKE